MQSAAAQAALQAAQALAGQSETQGGPNTVLRVIVEHMVYPVTLDVLFQVTTSAQFSFRAIQKKKSCGFTGREGMDGPGAKEEKRFD